MISSRKDYENACKEEVSHFLNTNRVALRHVHKNNKPIGTVIAFFIKGQLKMGWSKCNKLDKYNRHVGISKAIDCALDGFIVRPVPHLLKDAINRLYDFVTSVEGRRCLT